MVSNQINVEYFFRLIYEFIYGARTPADYSAFTAFASHVWLWIIALGYALSVIGIFVIIYTTMRIFELRKREEVFYKTLIIPPDSPGGMHPRWEHILSLLEGAGASEWREAIIEADIMLDEVLSKRGYTGEGVGEKLKTANKTSFATLQDAWEAHKVRNQIAHQGSTFDLSETVARRTISRFEAVFREFKVI